MKLDIRSVHLDLSDAIRTFIEEKMAKLEPLLARFGDGVTTEVEVSRTTSHHHKGEVFRAEVHVRLPNHLIYMNDVAEDLYQAITQAVHKAERGVIDYKEEIS